MKHHFFAWTIIGLQSIHLANAADRNTEFKELRTKIGQLPADLQIKILQHVYHPEQYKKITKDFSCGIKTKKLLFFPTYYSSIKNYQLRKSYNMDDQFLKKEN